MSRIYTKNILGDIYKCPCRSTCQPAVLSLTMIFRITTGYHLGIYIRLCSVNLTDIFYISRTGLLIYFKGSVTTSDDSLSDGDPWIVVAEDTGIFLISGWIGGDFTKFEVISVYKQAAGS